MFQAFGDWRYHLSEFIKFSDVNRCLVREGMTMLAVWHEFNKCTLILEPTLQPILKMDEGKDVVWYQVLNFRHFELALLRVKLNIDPKMSKKKTLFFLLTKLHETDSFTSVLNSAVDLVKRDTQIRVEGHEIVSCYGSYHLIRQVPLHDQRTTKLRFVFKYPGLQGIPWHQVYLLVAPQPAKKNSNLTPFYPNGRLKINGVECNVDSKRVAPQNLSKLLFKDQNNLFDYEFDLADDRFTYG